MTSSPRRSSDTSAAPCHWRRAGRRVLQLGIALVVAAASFLLALPQAFAGVGFGVTPTFPTTVTVGQTGLPASLQITNTATPPETGGNVTINTINLVPSCGTTAFVGAGDCPIAEADPGFSCSHERRSW